jgi:hypothetical protein
VLCIDGARSESHVVVNRSNLEPPEHTAMKAREYDLPVMIDVASLEAARRG